MSNPVPIPAHERLVFARDRARYRGAAQDPNEGKITPRWLEWFSEQNQLLTTAAQRLFDVTKTDQSASLSATDMSSGALAAGLYRVSYYATVTQAATVSSSLIVTLDWTDRTNTKTLTGSAMTGNTLGTVQIGGGLIRIDKNSPIRYATTYVSVGATSMTYDLVLTLERVQ